MLTWLYEVGRIRSRRSKYFKMASYAQIGIPLLYFTVLVTAVTRENFRTCDQTSFCRRCRKMEPGKSPYELIAESVLHNQTTLSVDLSNKETGILYVLKLTALRDNSFRLYINEKSPLHPRYEVEFSLQGEPQLSQIDSVDQTEQSVTIKSGLNKAVLFFKPFRVDFYSQDQLVTSANSRGLMRFEHIRRKPETKPKSEQKIDESPEDSSKQAESQFLGNTVDNDPGTWEENFKSHHDTKPLGPEAVALDFSFPGSSNVYGVPEHAESLALKSTKQTSPYRLFNLDVFEYELYEKMSLYGAVPVLYSHGKERTCGIFWLNSAETWIDIVSNADNNVVESIVNYVSGSKKSQVDAHFMSESGVIDVFFMLGPKPLDVFRQYTHLTGTAPLPQIFTLGYHQSRWNYNDQEDVQQIAESFDRFDMPMDVMWLDIEYTDSKKYFTWDPRRFPNPIGMIQNLTMKGRKLVTIIDPHIKRDDSYHIHIDATRMGLYVKTPDGKDYEGWCWPGSSSYLDFYNPKVREYYMKQYSSENFPGTTNDVYIWNDMNEPSVFNGPEVTMPKDMIHFGGWEHRDVHNTYGLMQTMATYDALMIRSDRSLRPFILTRSFFAGSQRYAAVWTGDNAGEWGHLKISFPMCLSLAISGISFCGADVSGYFKNPDAELFVRWNQAGAWLPFFRQHSHIETKRREPWTFSDEVTQIVREALRLRYSYLPLWYTLFREHEINGTPVLRPLWAHYPDEFETYTIDDEIMVGDSILVCPIFEPGVTDVNIYLPGEGKVSWYDIDTMQQHGQQSKITVPVTLHKIPVYQRSGSIVPRKMRIRRSTVAMKNDPYTLVVIADSIGKATGTLYIDDEVSFEYRHGKYLYLRFSLDGNTLISKLLDTEANYETSSCLERIDIVNPPKGIKSALLKSKSLGEVILETKYNPHNNVLVVRKPSVNMGEEWTIELIQ